jgi:hypothetical protein
LNNQSRGYEFSNVLMVWQSILENYFVETYFIIWYFKYVNFENKIKI